MNQRCFSGWDIGGAHLKMVSVSATGQPLTAIQLAAPVWHGLEHLQQALAEALGQLPVAAGRHALTMTGELADCFPDRVEGVTTLLDCAEQSLGRDLHVYMPDGLTSLKAARAKPELVASANWHASAGLAGQWYDQAVLVDIGSTTTDIIAVRDGRPAVQGYTDQARMQYDELVYTGVVRTPVMAVVQRAPVAGHEQHLASEQFAVMADVYRLTGELPAMADQTPTADDGPRDSQGSARRLARMACADFHETETAQWRALAEHIKHCQLRLLATALGRVIERHALDDNAVIIGAGCGRFLVEQLADRLQRPYTDAASCIRMANEPVINNRIADMLPAYAMADLLYRSAAGQSG